MAVWMVSLEQWWWLGTGDERRPGQDRRWAAVESRCARGLRLPQSASTVSMPGRWGRLSRDQGGGTVPPPEAPCAQRLGLVAARGLGALSVRCQRLAV